MLPRANPSSERRPTPASQSDASASNAQSAPPAISLPKGGGAIRGIGEKFAANPVTGTGALSVPIAVSPGRSGFGPHFSLAYDSGAGNGPFGFGWRLGLPAITRKTDKGLPRYRDDEESDVFILSDAEDLVPVLVEKHGQWRRHGVVRVQEGARYRVEAYRPRVEGLFARVERWTSLGTGETHWRSITRDNVTTLYGTDNSSRIFDPDDPDPAHPTRVFSWLICQSYDDKGNAIVYEYKAEDSDGVDLAQAHERNRAPEARAANRYLKRVRYGNRVSRLAQPDLARADWMFELVFDYGEHDALAPTPRETGAWLCRNDPFSSHRAGFETRTYRLCQRVLMFHHFPDELGVGRDCLVRSTDLAYRETRGDPADRRRGHPIGAFVAAIAQSGYRRTAGGYLRKSLPPLEFEYSQATIQEEIREVDGASLENLPYGLDSTRYQWVDLDGEGVSGIITEQAESWFYKRNLSPITWRDDGDGATTVARFAPAELVARQPALVGAPGARPQFLDLAGDGRLDLVRLSRPDPGFYERRDDGDWAPFQPFESTPTIDSNDANLRFVDLTGDGHADILVTEDNIFTWYPALAEQGFGGAERVHQALDEERGPRLVLADGAQSIYLADMSGDGLADLVRVRNGEVCYWPSLGYGRFGAKVTLDNAPWFDRPDLFDQRRVRLADIDGSGVTDVIYLGTDGVQIYFNESGNRLSDARIIRAFPQIDNLAAVNALDLLGNGTACLVWSTPLPGEARRAMRYIDLMGGQKPHLLVGVRNNLGAETRVRYAPSTRFYLADKAADRPWATRLPFPVQVVERLEIFDRISRNRFVTRYAYHHGYFDGVEREFRGFGMVEQWDTEEFAALAAGDTFPAAANLDAASHVPPVWTKTWFHTGVFLEGERVSRHFAGEYFDEAGLGEDAGLTGTQRQAMLLDDTVLPDTIRHADGRRTPYVLFGDEAREACRALKGSILRQEIYALDGSAEQALPYSVSERNYTVELLQPQSGNRNAVFFTHARETVDFHYERKVYGIPLLGGALARRMDPRVSHALTLVVDVFGNLLRSAAIGYGRRLDDPDPVLTDDDRSKQRRALISVTENRYTNAVDLDDAYRTPLPCEARTYELLHVEPDAREPLVTNLFRFAELARKVAAAGDGAHDLPYEDVDGAGATGGAPYRRLIEHARTLYRRDDLAGPLALGRLEPLALPFESYKLAFTPGLVTQAYRRERGGSVEDLLGDLRRLLGNEGRYLQSEAYRNSGLFPQDDPPDHWWLPSGQVFYAPDTGGAAGEAMYARQHFYRPIRFRDPFDNTTAITYDSYDLLILQSRDPLDNLTSAGERTSEGALASHANDYRVLQPRLIMDANRNRAAVAFDALGMVAGTAVMGKPEQRLGDSLDGFEPDPAPEVVEAHLRDPFANPQSLLQRATTRIVYDLFAYQRTQVEAHPHPVLACTLARETHDSDLADGQLVPIQHSFSYSDGFGREIQRKEQAEAGPIDEGGSALERRWVGSGWTIFNNKGKPVRQYEPFFTGTHAFESARIEGVSTVLFYDPVERVIATLHPNHTYEKITLDPWRRMMWDVNDTVLLDPRDDDDIRGYTRTFMEQLADRPEGWQTWYAQRREGVLGPEEQAAAAKTAVHAGTPTRAHFDALGRPFMTVTHNRYQNEGAVVEELLRTHVELDIEGNERATVDPRGRTLVMQDFDMLSSKIRIRSADAGETITLLDAGGKTIRAWDSRGYATEISYDPLRRPTRVYVSHGVAAAKLVERTVYGEAHPDAVILNLRTRYYQHFDGAGVVVSEENDFQGNALRTTRRLANGYRDEVDWSSIDAIGDARLIAALPEDRLEQEYFTIATTYDALSRPTAITTPDQTVVRPTYNRARLLERVEANLRGADEPTTFVGDIDYNAKGQRLRIAYGNADDLVETRYSYDPQTFRLIRLLTKRGAEWPDDCPQPGKAPGGLQNLQYTYDPNGNITHIRDEAQQAVFFKNAVVSSRAEYTYDALYRLIAATGREHAGSPGAPQTTWDDGPRVGLPHPHDGQALRRYAEQYEYDEVGNILRMIHRAQGGDWTRAYRYDEPSALAGGLISNRLSGTQVGDNPSEIYAYDEHGNLLTMPHIARMEWDHKDRLRMIDRGGGGKVYHVYDANGQRVRKVAERQNGTRQHERIYVGSFEIYREYDGNGEGVVLARETLHVTDDTRRIALVETRTQGEDEAPAQLIRYQHDNQLGTACLELDSKARVISYEEYYPFGATAYQATRSRVEAPKRYRFTGKERDEESGFYYHGARYYIPWLGRWASVDPAGFADGLNVYAYVRNNPVNYSDPTGHLSWGQWAGIAAAVVVGTVVTVATAGLAGPVVGAAAATVIGGIVGGAAGSAVGEIVEAKVDGRPVTAANVGKAALIGGITGGLLAGGGVAVSAALRTTAGQAVRAGIASTATGQFIGSVARRIAQSGVGRGLSRGAAAIREPAERLGQRISERLGVGPGAKMAQGAIERAAAGQMNVQQVQGVARQVTSASEGQTFSHSVGWRGGHPLGPGVTGAQVEAQSALRVSPGGSSGQWGEGAYAFEGTVAQNPSGSSFQFKVPPQTAVETITPPGGKPIVRLVPPPGESSMPIRITGNDFPADALQRGRGIVQEMGIGGPPTRFGYPGVSPDTTGLGGGFGQAGGVFVAPIAPKDEKGPWTPAVGVSF